MAYNRQTGMYEGFIYRIWNDIDDVFYIGRTYRTVNKRWSEHRKSSEDCCTDLYDGMRDYGLEHFYIEVIDEFEATTKPEIKQMCIEREMAWIKHFKDCGCKLYNMTEGGDDLKEKAFPERPVIQYDLFCNELARFDSIAEAGEISGVRHSDISKCCSKKGNRAGDFIWRYLEEPLTHQEIEQLNEKFKGVCQYDFDGNLLNTFYRQCDAIEHIQKTENKTIIPAVMSGCMRGINVSAGGYVWRYRNDPFDKYPIPPRHIRKVHQYSFDGILIGVYDNCADAAMKTGVDPTSINQCCLKNYQKGGGYLWCYEGDTVNTNIKPKERPVDRYDLDSNYIDSYDSIMDASRKLNINDRNIGAVCQNKRSKASGYVWRYKGDPFDLTNKGGDQVA